MNSPAGAPEMPPRVAPVDPAHLAEAGRVDWRTALRRAIRDDQTLRATLGLPLVDEPSCEAKFQTFFPLEMLS
ncbi:MAG: hypothetical protein AAF664_15410, partial [Planctomycetota bacterium]